MRPRRGLLLAAILGAALPCRAGALLGDVAALELALRAAPPCCIIDARTHAPRGTHPLPRALVYRDDLRIAPTGPVVVVADSDAEALAVAQTLAHAYPGSTVFAVEGGVAAWEAVMRTIAAEPPGGRAPGFVIPRNTCEPGVTIQRLRSEPR